MKEDTLVFYLNGVRCSFFDYPYKLVGKTLKHFGVEIASDEDIAAMKCVAIIQRGTKKDFFDLYFLMKLHKWTLVDVEKLCVKKYGSLFPIPSFKKALIYFEDADKQSYPSIDPEWEKVKNFFRSELLRYFKA